MWGRRIRRESQEAPGDVSTVRLTPEKDQEEWEHQNITNSCVPQVGVKLL